jgi:hypothetical protein
MPPYILRVRDLGDNAVEVASQDEESLAVIRDEVKLHGFEVGELERRAGAHRFRAKSDEPGKVREFLGGLADVEVHDEPNG